MQDLGLDLLPLRPIVQQEQLDLPDEFLLPPIYIILLHLEGALDIAQEQVCVIQLLICLLRARVYHSETDRLLANDWNDRRMKHLRADLVILQFKLLFNLRQSIIDGLDATLHRDKLLANLVVQTLF